MQETDPKTLDLLIIGAGPAGMTAALYASRHGLQFQILGKLPGGSANLAPIVGSYPGCAKMPGRELMARFQQNLEEAGVRISEEQVQSVKREGRDFTVKTENRTLRARSLIIATGRRDSKLGVKGEDKYFGKGLSYCAVCDGPLFKNKTVAVIGGGRSGLLAAMFMQKMMKKIYVIEKSAALGGPEITREIEKYVHAVRKAGNIEIITSTSTREIVGNKKVTSVKLRSKGKTSLLPVDAVFVEIGYTPNSELVKGLARLNKRGEIIIDKNSHTSAPGVYAAGDVTDVISKQIITSCGEGAKALIQVSSYIASLKKG